MAPEKTLQQLIGLDDTDELIDLKMSIDDNKTPPSEFVNQIKNIIKADRDDLLTEFVDY